MNEKVNITLSILNYDGWRFGLSVSTSNSRIRRILEELGVYVGSYNSYERKNNFIKVMNIIGKYPEDYGLGDLLTDWWHSVQFSQVSRLIEVKDEIMEDIAAMFARAIEIASKQQTRRYVELIPKSSRPSTVPKRKLSKRIFMQFGNTVYEVELRKVKDIESIDELPDLIEEKVRDQVELEYAATIHSLEKQIEGLKNRLIKARADAVKESWKYFSNLFKMGWQVDDDGKFVFSGRIYAKYVKEQKDDRLITYLIPESERKFYVDTIRFDPNWNEITVDRAFNPHVDGSVCTGDYQLNLESLDKVFELFETINLNSMFPNRAATEIQKLLEAGKLEKIKEEVITYVE